MEVLLSIEGSEPKVNVQVGQSDFEGFACEWHYAELIEISYSQVKLTLTWRD